jgi:hypothetical protein
MTVAGAIKNNDIADLWISEDLEHRLDALPKAGKKRPWLHW